MILLLQLKNHSESNTMRGTVLIILLLLLITGLQGAVKEITVIHTTDTHGRIYGSGNGWLKAAPAIRQEIAAAGGAANCLVIDCGDIMQGTPESAFSGGAIMIKILNELAYDVWIPGNHDFDFGSDALKTNISNFRGTVLTANVESTKLAGVIRPWRIFEKNNLKIAVIGMTSPNLLSYLWLPESGRLKVYGIESSLGRIIAAVRQTKPDIIVLIIHHGQYSKDTALYDLTLKYPEIDLILGGHTHQEVSGVKIGRNCWFAQAGHAAGCFGKINIAWDDDAKKIIRISSVLIPVQTATPDDNALHQAIDDDLRAVSGFYSMPIPGNPERIKEITGRLTGDPGTIIAGAMAESSGVGIALYSHSRWPIKPELGLNAKTIFYLMPYEDTVCTLTLNADEFKAVLHEQSAQLKKYKSSPSLYGVTTETDPQTCEVKKLILADGTPWQGTDKKIRIAFSSFPLAGGGGVFPLLREYAADSKKLPENTGVLVRACVRKYIEKMAATEDKIDKNITAKKR